jgi:hypothetical protein
MAKKTLLGEKGVKPKIRRKGVHSKNNTSGLKASRNYRKAYRGQGR